MLLCLVLSVACRPAGPETIPTIATGAATAAISDEDTGANLPPTWTPDSGGAVAAATVPGRSTFTPRPSQTPLILPTQISMPASPTRSAPPVATIAATSTLTPTPSDTPPPVNSSQNLLPNPSFEEGWYHINGVPELQVANQWILEWEEGENDLDPDPWNAWVRPESRVLTTDFLPDHEHDTFIWDGEQTVKVFKGTGAIHFRLLTDVSLPAGTYVLEINFFPDLIDGYNPDGSKIWAPDELSGEVRFLVDGQTTDWVLPIFGRKNTMTHVFTLNEGRTIRLGAAFRGRWAITNNGWFMDDWSLYQVAEN